MSSLREPAEPLPDPGECVDLERKRCKIWVDAGECEKNPGYMVRGRGGVCVAEARVVDT